MAILTLKGVEIIHELFKVINVQRFTIVIKSCLRFLVDALTCVRCRRAAEAALDMGITNYAKIQEFAL